MSTFNPNLDLVLEKYIDVSPELVWMAWTQPEHLKKWFTPAPWKTIDCEIDLRPGGVFRTILRSPEGAEVPNVGCYLEVVPSRRLVWTNALERDYRPSVQDTNLGFYFTALLTFEPHGSGTRFTAVVMHHDEESRRKHDEMGFQTGWGQALDQLIAHVKNAIRSN